MTLFPLRAREAGGVPGLKAWEYATVRSKHREEGPNRVINSTLFGHIMKARTTTERGAKMMGGVGELGDLALGRVKLQGQQVELHWREGR